MRARFAGAAAVVVIAVAAVLALWPDAAGSEHRYAAIVSAQAAESITATDLVGRTIDDADTVDDLTIWLAEHTDARHDEIEQLMAIDLDEQVVYAIVEETCRRNQRPQLIIDQGSRRFTNVVDQTCSDGWRLVVSVFAVDESHRAALDESSYEG